MAPGGSIKLTTTLLAQVTSATTEASNTLGASAAPVATSIPTDAFGSLGAPIAAAGNLVGKGLGDALTKLAQLAWATGDGARATSVEFERIDDSAASVFTKIGAKAQR